MDRRTVITAGAVSLLALGAPMRLFAQAPANSQGNGLKAEEIDALVEAFRAKFEVPGIAVSIVRPGLPPLTKGYGLRVMGQGGAVDDHTLFAIASNSKAFTSALLAQLVDAGKLTWDDPVIKHLPEFQLYDADVTRMMTVRDLLIHNSGLPLGAGDLMSFPTTSHTLEDILHGLRYLKPETAFRTTYAYDNNLYLVAGIIISRLTGQSWEAAVTDRILKPLGMNETVAGFSALHDGNRGGNLAGRHARLGPPVRGLGSLKVVHPVDQDKIDAAGGLNASAHDAAAWLSVQLARGRLPNGERLWSEAQAREMWTPRTIVGSGPGPDDKSPTRSVLGAYALGWFVGQYRNQRLLSHAGGLLGQVTQHAILPELGYGVAVYSNTEDGYVSTGLRNALLDRLVGVSETDWLALTTTRRDTQFAEALKDSQGGAPQKPDGAPSLPLAAYAGRYRDPWYGDILVTQEKGGLAITFTRTPAFKGPLEVWGKDAFRTHFAGDDIEDAVVSFTVADGKVTDVTMKALSPLADFSFDFQHLAFMPVA